MKKLILIILLCPLFSFGQQYVSDSTTVKAAFKGYAKSATQKYDDLSLPAATSTTDGYATKDQVNLLVTTAAKANSTEAALAVAVADLKAANDRIARLEALAPGIPEPGEINTSTYTLTAADNGKTILAKVGCTITIPAMSAGFKCWIVRKEKSVKFTGNYTKRTGFTPLASINQKVEIHYDTDTQATIY
jgi:hypothetical protein